MFVAENALRLRNDFFVDLPSLKSITKSHVTAYMRHFPGGRKPWELSAENRRELGYDFVVPATCASLNATAVKPPKIIESSEGRRARRAARLAKARRRKPPVRKEERVPKWVHVVEE